MPECDEEIVFENNQEIQCKFVKNTLCVEGENNIKLDDAIKLVLGE